MSGHIVFAALALSLTTGKELRVLPAGDFRAVDGRPGNGRSWRLTPERGAQIVARAQLMTVDFNIDYDHQAMLSKENGQPAPAAGWFKNLEWRGNGLYATDVRWTPRAQASLAAKEYRYISPAFEFDPHTLEVLGLINVALTNTPALHELGEIGALSLQLQQKAQPDSAALAERKDMARRLGMSVAALDAAIAESKAEELERESAGLTQKQREMLEHINGGPLTS